MLMVTEPSAEARLSRFEDETLEGIALAATHWCSYCEIGSSAPGITAHFVMLMVTEPSAEARLSRFEDETLEGIALAATHWVCSYESRPRNSEQACLDFATVHSTQCLCSQEKVLYVCQKIEY
ncbi:hypothetical protein EJB05_14422 [Eragrostis curvula]|uniref:Uncharacterized protein n=1 Tax=Eragrostis curvula TaxID=38414 RepID=A0A5J9VZ74_9POAL|nr:hypothetical protein EJB05_14422 [Eragrostis curvula]